MPSSCSAGRSSRCSGKGLLWLASCEADRCIGCGRGVVYYGSARLKDDSRHWEQAQQLGHAVAKLLHSPTWSGAGPGMMQAASEGAITLTAATLTLNPRLLMRPRSTCRRCSQQGSLLAS